LAQRAMLSCYPVALIDEYRTLVKMELNGSLTPNEASRIQSVREQINAIDRQRPRPDAWDIQRAKLQEELAQLRAEIDELPEA
jgi:hypothetical protein